MLSNVWAHRLILLAMLLTALWLRVHQLENIPTGLHFDEAANAILSSEIAFDGYRPIFISSYTGKETFFFYAAGGIMRLLGSSIFSLRLTAAFFGLLTISTTYQLGTTIFRDRRVALIAAILLTTNFSHLLFSRLGFRAIAQPLTQALTILFLIKGFQHLHQNQSAKSYFAAAGIFLGLTAHTYLAARLFPIALAIPLLIFIIFQFMGRQQIPRPTEIIRSLVQTGVIALIVLAPLLYWFSLYPETFWVRIGQVGSTNNSITIAEGLQRAVLMLFWDGDPYIRFNLPHRPLFFPLMIVPAIVGVWRIAIKGKDEIYGAFFGRLVLLIAPLVMLLPTALAVSEIVPSNLRAIGIFPFIIFWPAVGLVWIAEKLLQWVTDRSETAVPLATVFVPLFIILLGSSAVNVYRDYFTIWGNRSDSFYETEGDIREVANYLNQVDSNRPIVVSTRFVPHPSLAFLANNYDRLILIPESKAIVYPAGQQPLYIFPASSSENNWINSFIGERETLFSENQDPILSTLAINQPFPESQSAAFSNFGFAIKLTGYDLELGQVGESLTLRTYHEVLGNPGFNMVPFVHLEDHLGNRWSQLEQPGYSPNDWQKGDQFVQQFIVTLPAGMPPTNSYTLRIGWFDGATGQEVTQFDADGQFAGSAFHIQPVAILPNKSATIFQEAPQRLNKRVMEGLVLNGIDFKRQQFSQGDTVNFALWWQAESDILDGKLVTQISREGLTIELETADPAGDSYPFSAWQTPSFIIDHHQIKLPANLPPGDWQLQTVAQFNDQTAVPLFDPITINVEALDLILEIPTFEQAINVSFEEQIGLVGYSLDNDSGQLEIVWQTIGEPTGDYVAFVQLLNGDQTCCAWQADRPLVSSAIRPTSRWVVGEYVIEQYEIEGYRVGQPIIVGLYRPENGIRLTTNQSADFVQLR